MAREYVGLDEKFGYWRDTHMRITGSSVSALQARFILDWNFAAKKRTLPFEKYMEEPDIRSGAHCPMQIVTSGPDSLVQSIRNTYLRLIHKAKHSIYIQTPYFIPDEAIMSALMIAVRSGVEVNIMIPCKPDHPFVYWATYSYVGELALQGANCYTYNNGFLHAKGIVVDELVLSYGTANMDIRSFSLNFEVNAIIYDREKAREMTEILKNKEKCDVIICISHLGWKIDGIDDSEVAPATRNIDLILGGHSHTYFKQLEYLNNLDGKPVPVDQNGKNAIWVGKMTLDIVKNK